ncbi:MAG: hypothetical protein KGJ23_08865 [Euryarchaeota archaeon]|nr:hypothetical protein [Euryarchaeota archaeon]MDE1836715.1 hypothetical protein [Euryarchaeota archaeon]MDE1881744.1 hypothetical protein [Euryarchaeota archaeon]
MVQVTVSPEAIVSVRGLPSEAKEAFDHMILEMVHAPRLTLPGRWNAHALEGGEGLWTYC